MTKSPALSATCWIVTEGLAGTENQCIGVAEALGVMPEIKRITLRQPWKLLSPYLGFENANSFAPDLTPPWPDILIASGRKSIAASRYIQKMSGGQTFTVQIQDPRISPKHFDLVAVPKHDPTRGENVIVTTAAPNKITPVKLAVAREEFKQFADLPSPRIAVLVGGSSQSYTMNADTVRKLADQLKALDAGLMITTSRRTGAQNEQTLKAALADKQAYIWDGQAPNPFMGMLAWADFILVTADSTSMLSEAASTGKPTYLIELEGGSPRLNDMQRNLEESGNIRRFEGTLESWPVIPLNDAQKVATEIRRRLSARAGLSAL
jgi:mitochondrial fission protein ELM1